MPVERSREIRAARGDWEVAVLQSALDCKDDGGNQAELDARHRQINVFVNFQRIRLEGYCKTQRADPSPGKRGS